MKTFFCLSSWVDFFYVKEANTSYCLLSDRIFVTSDIFSEAATWGVLWKKVFLEISQNSQENTCARVLFNKVAGLRPATLLKKRLCHRCFPVNFVKYLRTPFYRTPLDDCFWFFPTVIISYPAVFVWYLKNFFKPCWSLGNIWILEKLKFFYLENEKSFQIETKYIFLGFTSALL